jgi:hypothetical protein
MYELARDPHVVEVGVNFRGKVPPGNDCRGAWLGAYGEAPVASPPTAPASTTMTVTIPIYITITIAAPVPAQPPQSPPPAVAPRKPGPDPRKTVANFLASGKREVVTTEHVDAEGVSAPLDPAWLASVKKCAVRSGRGPQRHVPEAHRAAAGSRSHNAPVG